MKGWRGSCLPGGSTLLALLVLGCGHSSSGKSTSTPSGSSGQATAASSTPQPPPPAPSSETVTGTSGGVTATLHAGTHHPLVGRPWPLRFTVTRGGRAARASVRYQYLFAGQIVGRRSHYTFTGSFSDIFNWPSRAVGYPLTFRAVIVSGAVTINLDYPVQVTE